MPAEETRFAEREKEVGEWGKKRPERVPSQKSVTKKKVEKNQTRGGSVWKHRKCNQKAEYDGPGREGTMVPRKAKFGEKRSHQLNERSLPDL